MDIAEYVKGLPRTSKKEDIPGAFDSYLDELCPVPGCGKRLKLMRPCCGSPYGKKECVCGYKINITGDKR